MKNKDNPTLTPSLSAQHQQILHNQIIDDNSPGTILHDFEKLLEFIGSEGVSVSGKNNLFSLKLLPQLNAQMTRPIEIDLKRPQQTSYPYLNGLYLLLRAAGLAVVEGFGSKQKMIIDKAVLQFWQALNSTERYLTLFETWMLKGDPEIIGERGGLVDAPFIKWAQFFKRIPGKGLKITGNREEEGLIIYLPGLYTLALLDLFGLVAVHHAKPETGMGWRIARVDRTPFGDAASLFLDNRLEDARKAYEALFTLISYINENTYFSLGQEIDIREARARYCRCVYETADAKKRLDEFVTAMEVGAFSTTSENDYDESYPLLQDVIEASPEEMEDLASFLPVWKKVLDKSGTKGRAAVLLLEAVNRLEGIKGVSRLSRKWKNSQPQGYIFWLNILNQENDGQGILSVSKEGLKALKEGRFRERVAEFLIDAAEKLNNRKQLLIGKRERFFSHRSDQNLLDLMDEAIKDQVREKELDTVIQSFNTRKSMDNNEKPLYVKTLLMSGKLNGAFSIARKEKSVGWSYQSSAGVVFGSALLVLAAYSEKADTIKSLLKNYANKESIYSGRISTDDGSSISVYGEIIRGLRQINVTKSQTTQYLLWVEKIGKARIDHIVSNKHRRAYGRAAQVLGSLAEIYAATGQKSKADKILHTYYNEKYNRFSAFRREVKAVVMASGLLRNSRFFIWAGSGPSSRLRRSRNPPLEG